MAKKHKPRFSGVQKTVFGIICICFIIVGIVLIISFINKPEKQVKDLISRLAGDYYENHLFTSFNQSDEYNNNRDEMMKLYEKNGFSSINLRQILLYDNQKNARYAEFLKNYCDENNTTIKIYPEAPFEINNYRIDYSYSCEF